MQLQYFLSVTKNGIYLLYLTFIIILNYRSQRDLSEKICFAQLEAASEQSRRSADKKAKKAERDAGYKLLEAMENAAAEESLNANFSAKWVVFNISRVLKFWISGHLEHIHFE